MTATINDDKQQQACCSSQNQTQTQTQHNYQESNKNDQLKSQKLRQQEKRPSIQSEQSSLSSTSSGSNESSGRNNNNLLSSNADYDHIRNTTLMFFLDRLYLASKDGQEARTLHDLSCLFGTRDFTKEMRQIVGASRNGLKKFLQSYPSLFTIDGDKVYLSQLKQDSTNSSCRDYNKEAVDYFKQKLQQFGTSLVPIRNLFGYRSQASQEVRHVSGKNSKEFKQFLLAHENVFKILADEHVVLLSAFKELEQNGNLDSSLLLSMKQLSNLEQLDEQQHNHHHQQSNDLSIEQEENQPSSSSLNINNNNKSIVKDDTTNFVMDPYLNKQFAHTIENLIMKMNLGENDNPDKITIKFLHEKILQDCNNELFLKMVKTIEDLKIFLRMHPRIFKRININNNSNSKMSDSYENEFVCLVSDEERREMETQAYPSLSFQLNKTTIKRCDTNESNISDLSNNNQTSLPTFNNNNKQTNLEQPMSMINQYSSSSNHNKKKTTTTTTSDLLLTNNDSNNDASDARSITSTTSSHNNSSLNGGNSSLRATAPPFVPNSNGNINRHQNQQNFQNDRKQQPLQRSISNHSHSNQQSRDHQSNHHHNHQHVSRNQSIDYHQNHNNYHHQYQNSQILEHNQNQHQQQRNNNHMSGIQRSYSVKWNSNNSYQSSSNANSNIKSNYNNNNNNNNSNYHQPLIRRQHSNFTKLSNTNQTNSDDLRARTVNIVREASNIISRIMSTTDAVAFDCKGYNLGFNGQITLIQFAWLPKKQISSTSINHQNLNSLSSSIEQRENKRQNLNDENLKQKPEVCIFDLITNPELAYCLKPLLESDSIVKIVHDVRNKSNALYVQFDIMLNHVFDTQVANLVIQQQETGKPAYKSRYISMSKLCEIYGDELLIKYRNLIQSKTRHSTNNNGNNNSSNNNKIKDVNYWKTRPLTDAMVCESTIDVYSLVNGVYQNLKSKIKPEYKPLFEQLNLEGVLARIKPDEIRSVKKERKIDLEVIDLKRKLYSDSKSTIVLSNREIRLLRHIDLTDEVRNRIQQCKKVAKKLERLDMKAAQQLQLMNNNNNNNNDQNLSLQTNDSSSSSSTNSTTSASALCSAKSFDNNNDNQQQNNRLDSDEVDELIATTSGVVAQLGDMGNLMDSEMFVELKDKMIESSSSLLESLNYDNDDQQIEAATGLISTKTSQQKFAHNNNHTKRSFEHSGSQCSSCGCNCQKDISIDDQINQQQSISIKSDDKSLNEENLTIHSTVVEKENFETTESAHSDQLNVNDKIKVLKEKENLITILNNEDKESPDSNKAVDMAVQCDLLG